MCTSGRHLHRNSWLYNTVIYNFCSPLHMHGTIGEKVVVIFRKSCVKEMCEIDHLLQKLFRHKFNATSHVIYCTSVIFYEIQWKITLHWVYVNVSVILTWYHNIIDIHLSLFQHQTWCSFQGYGSESWNIANFTECLLCFQLILLTCSIVL
jgi:hypothetical protein